MNQEQRKQVSFILAGLGEELDITENQYKEAVKSYMAVGEWLSGEGSSLAPYKPEILPQGSFLLGTMTKPVNPKDDLDIDLVCRLNGIKIGWTAYDLKQAVGNRLKMHAGYAEMLTPEGRRCWTLNYAESRGFHLDVLPSVVGQDFFNLMEGSISDAQMQNARNLAIRITDKLSINYRTATNPFEWPLSNMFGFAAWFKYRSQVATIRKAIALSESISPVPGYTKKKLPLQIIVQTLKRHRDIMFNGDEHKPISIIITTLAAWAYNGEEGLLQGLQDVVNNMERYIDQRVDPFTNRKISWIGNPVNPSENFADKWVLYPRKAENFWKWMAQVKKDVSLIAMQNNLMGIKESLSKSFGSDLTRSVFTNVGDNVLQQRESNQLFMSAGSGMLGTSGRTEVINHKFFGANE
jgi:hypothetical protein